ncbi:MAG TPA: homoserine dehydrogenase [Vicinamibacteria bacterium]|nr:homoserine dehydrogenase [Vicinamibacteria bacterium]
MRTLRLALVGFGNVGRRFAELLPGPYSRVLRANGVRPVVTGIATGRHGLAIDPRGLPLARALRLVRGGRSLDALHRGKAVPDVAGFVRRVPADVLVELSPLDPRRGEPATSHVRAALRRGLHVVTANKGPVAFARRSLVALARRRGRLFLHEGVVMDGTPVFNLCERCLPGARILGFRGVLNSTTTRILSRMEAGVSFDAALREAQAAGVAEADPRNDVDGWDAAVKGCALANALMDADVRPRDVARVGIAGVSMTDVGGAREAGERIRLVVRGRRRGRSVRVSVAPERIPIGDLLVTPGADGILVIETDLMREIGIWEGPGGVDQTAFAVLSDLAAVARVL